MKKLANKLENRFHIRQRVRSFMSHSEHAGPVDYGPADDQPQGSSSAPQRAYGNSAPTTAEINRYRLSHGVNAAALFVLERWMDDSMFIKDGSSELSSVKAYAETHGLAAAQRWREEHWMAAVSEADWKWLKDAQITTIRLPIGWYCLGPAFCQGTAFEDVGQVYASAWEHIKGFVRQAAQHSISVIIDLHCLPGGANEFDHSGTDSKAAQFLENPRFQDIATEALLYIAREIINDVVLNEWVAGLEIVNETTLPTHGGMFPWYDRVLYSLAAVNRSLPVYICSLRDDWEYLEYAAGKNAASRTDPSISPPVAVDVHKYFCFSEQPKPIHDIIQHDIPSALGELHAFGEKEVGVIVGEYSCGIQPESLDQRTADERIRQFGGAQTARYHDAFPSLSGGSFFWAFHKVKGRGGWDFYDNVNAGNIPVPWHLILPPDQIVSIINSARQSLPSMEQRAYDEHTGYWKKHGNGCLLEHWRFQDGYGIGYADALAFFQKRSEQGQPGGDKIGMLNLWVGRRLREHIAMHGSHGNLWEFEHGLRRGVRDMNSFIK